MLKHTVKHFHSRGWRRVEIRTDSTYAIKAIRVYAPNWRNNADENGNWYNSKGKLNIHSWDSFF